MINLIIFFIWLVNAFVFIKVCIKISALSTSLAINESSVFRLLGNPSGLNSTSAAKLITYCFKLPDEKIHIGVVNAARDLKSAVKLQLFAFMIFLALIFAVGISH